MDHSVNLGALPLKAGVEMYVRPLPRQLFVYDGVVFSEWINTSDTMSRMSPHRREEDSSKSVRLTVLHLMYLLYL